MKFRLTLCLGFCLPLGGCVVLPHSYYLPVSTAGELQKTVCDEYGPPDTLLFESDGVWIAVWLLLMEYEQPTDFEIDLPGSYKPGEDYLVLGIRIVGAPESVVVVTSPEVSVRVHPAESRKYAFNSFYRTENVVEPSGQGTAQTEKRVYTDIDIGEQLVFAPLVGHFETVYRGDIWLDARNAESVELERMDFEINGRRFAIENVSFVRKRGAYYYPLVGC